MYVISKQDTFQSETLSFLKIPTFPFRKGRRKGKKIIAEKMGERQEENLTTEEQDSEGREEGLEIILRQGTEEEIKVKREREREKQSER